MEFTSGFGYVGNMNSDRNVELAERMAVPEERMGTKQYEYKTDIARLAADFEKRDAELAKREVRLVITMVVVMGVAIAAATAVLGTMIAAVD